MSDQETPEIEEQESGRKPVFAQVQYSAGLGRSASSTATSADGAKAAPLWLITFTDVIALMLTFFVLLYAMSSPKEEEWNQLTEALSSKFQEYEGKPYNSGSQDVISIDRIQSAEGQNLTYLKNLIANLLQTRKIKNVILIEQDNRLIVSLPSELLFEAGRAEVGIEGKKVLFALSGILTRIKNNVGVIGHADPRAISGQDNTYRTNWELSLGRSAAVAGILKEVGYSRSLMVQGLASGRYDELPDTIPEDKRNDLSRRVDIVIYDHNGYRKGAFGAP